MFTITGFEGRTVAVFGLGATGLSAARALAAGGARVVAWDDNAASRDKVRALGIEPVFLGKPFPDIFDLALARLEHPPAAGRVLMVGDTLHTDILGGNQAGFATALVTAHGALKGLDVADAIRRAAIVPDFIVESI